MGKESVEDDMTRWRRVKVGVLVEGYDQVDQLPNCLSLS